MRLIFALVFLIGIGIAGTAVYLAMDRFEQYEQANRALRARTGTAVELTPVVVAAADLKYGAPLQRSQARLVQYPKASVPANAFSSLEDLFGPDGTQPRHILRTMEKDEAIMASKVTSFGEEAGVKARLAPGMRAFSISVDVVSGVSGFLEPGDRVDVYWTGESQGRNLSQLLLEDLELIAVDQVVDIDTNRPTVARTITVEVTPIVAATLTQARASGRLTLSLRGIGDEEIFGGLTVDQESILGIEEVVQEEEKRCFNNERRGGVLVQVEVPCSGN